MGLQESLPSILAIFFVFVTLETPKLQKAGMATVDRVPCGVEQCQVGAIIMDLNCTSNLEFMKQFVTALDKDLVPLKTSFLSCLRPKSKPVSSSDHR